MLDTPREPVEESGGRPTGNAPRDVWGVDWRSFLVRRLQRWIGCFNAAGQAAALPLVAAEHVKRR